MLSARNAWWRLAWPPWPPRRGVGRLRRYYRIKCSRSKETGFDLHFGPGTRRTDTGAARGAAFLDLVGLGSAGDPLNGIPLLRKHFCLRLRRPFQSELREKLRRRSLRIQVIHGGCRDITLTRHGQFTAVAEEAELRQGKQEVCAHVLLDRSEYTRQRLA